jgi:HPt (histidine-containing phosphotransfer) domain-containing protein
VSKNKVLEVLSGLRKKIANGTSTEISSVHARSEVRSPALDVESAVRKLGVNGTIYCKVLRAFCKDYKEMEAEFFKAIATEDLDGIQKRMHSLKGSSATLGAEDLCNMASKLDLLCREKQFPVAGQIAELLAELQSVIREAEQIVSEGHSEPEECAEILAVISATGLEEGLQALAVALDESLYDEINSEMNKIEGKLTGSPVANLRKMIRMYAYDDALGLLRKICSELNILLHDDIAD